MNYEYKDSPQYKSENKLISEFITSGLCDSKNKSIPNDHPQRLQLLWEALIWDKYRQILNFEKIELKDGMPDFKIRYKNKTIWIEATAPKKIVGTREHEENQSFEDGMIDNDKELAVWSGSISDKLKQLDKRISKNSLGKDEPYILAISNIANEGVFSYSYLPRSFPRVLQYLFPIGDEVSFYNRTTNERGVAYPHRGRFLNHNRSKIDCDIFINEGDIFTRVSAVLVHDHRSKTFDLIHNPNASNPIDTRMFDVDREWVKSDGENEIKNIRL